MKNNPVGALLVAGLFLCSAVSIGLVIYYLMTVSELARVRSQSLQMSSTMTFLQDLANTSLNFSRTNAAIDPILQQYSLKPRPAAPTGPAALSGTVRTNR